TGRGVNVDAAPRSASLGVVPVNGYCSMRHVAPFVVPGLPLRAGYLDVAAAPLAIAEDVGARRVRDGEAVNVEGVIVDSRRQWADGDAPDAVFPLRQGSGCRLQSRLHLATIDPDLLCLGRREAEGHLTIGLHIGGNHALTRLALEDRGVGRKERDGKQKDG